MLENVRGADAEPRSVVGRRISMAVLLAVLLAGLLGLLGDRDVTRTAEADGYTLSLTYPQTARTGLDRPWQLEITSENGFDDEITLAVTADYFDIYEHQGIDPELADATRDGIYLYWTFTAPEGDTFRVSLDQYIQPASQVGDSGVVALMVDGERVAPIEFSTFIFP